MASSTRPLIRSDAADGERYRGVAKNDFDAQRIAAVNNLLVIDRRVRVAEAERAAA